MDTCDPSAMTKCAVWEGWDGRKKDISLLIFQKKIPLKHVIERRLYPQVGSGEFLFNLDSWYVQGLCKNFFANLVA